MHISFQESNTENLEKATEDVVYDAYRKRKRGFGKL